MVLTAALLVSALLAARLVYRYDLYDREPWYVMAGVAAAGAAVMPLVGDLEDRVIPALGGGSPSIVHLALAAASLEELARLAIVVAAALLVPRHFNDPMDGLIYGSTAGIGMALEETAAYVTQASGLSLTATFPVELVRLFGHVLMGGITGFGVGMIRRPVAPRHWIASAAACVAAGIAFHFLWDLVALANVMSGGTDRPRIAAAVAVLLAGVALYGWLVVVGSARSRARFAPHSEARVWRRQGH